MARKKALEKQPNASVFSAGELASVRGPKTYHEIITEDNLDQEVRKDAAVIRERRARGIKFGARKKECRDRKLALRFREARELSKNSHLSDTALLRVIAKEFDLSLSAAFEAKKHGEEYLKK